MILVMKLREYIYSFPRGKRIQARRIIAEALNVSESAIKHWELGIRTPKDIYIEAIELVTGGQVTRDELLFKEESKAPKQQDQ